MRNWKGQRSMSVGTATSASGAVMTNAGCVCLKGLVAVVKKGSQRLARRKETMSNKVTCSTRGITKLGPVEAQGLLVTDNKKKYLLLDVREREEYEFGHIPGAKWIPLGELEHSSKDIERDRDIIVYCRSGRRSVAAAVLLCGLGFKKVHNLEGGLLGWGFDLVMGPPEELDALFASNKDLSGLLLVAFRSEYGAWYLYNQLGTRILDKKGLLKHLAEIEEGHMHLLYERLKGYWEGSPPPFEELRQAAAEGRLDSKISVDETFLKFDNSIRDDLEVIELAIEVEAKSYDLYTKMAEAIGDVELRQLFNRLATEEKGHIGYLSLELKQFLKTTQLVKNNTKT